MPEHAAAAGAGRGGGSPATSRPRRVGRRLRRVELGRVAATRVADGRADVRRSGHRVGLHAGTGSAVPAPRAAVRSIRDRGSAGGSVTASSVAGVGAGRGGDAHGTGPGAARQPPGGRFGSPVRVRPMQATQRWEYATVPLLVHATKQILDNWGEDGWELVAVVPGPNRSSSSRTSSGPRPAMRDERRPRTRLAELGLSLPR